MRSCAPENFGSPTVRRCRRFAALTRSDRLSLRFVFDQEDR